MMETELITTENRIVEVKVNNEVFTLTNKRLLRNNQFIGLNELRGASTTQVPVTYDKTNANERKVVKTWCILLLDIVFFVIMCNMMHPYKFFDYLAAFFIAGIGGLVFGTVISLPVYLLIKGYGAATSTTVDKCLFRIEKLDNSYFIHAYYDVDKMEELTTFCKELNSVVYR